MTCAFLKFLQLHADYENQTGGYGRSSLSDRKLCNRIGMNPRTVGQREFGSLFVEDRRKVGPPSMIASTPWSSSKRWLTALKIER